MIRYWKQLATAGSALLARQRKVVKNSQFLTKAHTLAYSIVALQEANLAYNYPMVYWNCANLISDSGGENSTVNYGKIATALSRVTKEGAKVVPPHINVARFDFRPDSNNNQIVYGLKPINGIGASQAKAIVDNQPYASLQDFIQKMKNLKETDESFSFGKSAIIQLIKAGSFDLIENKPREEIMRDYLSSLIKTTSCLSSKNIEDLNDLGVLTKSQQKNELRWIRYKNYVFTNENVSIKMGKSASTWFYKLENKYAYPYFMETFAQDLEEGKDYQYNNDGFLCVKRGSFDKLLDSKLENIKNTVFENASIIEFYNQSKLEALMEENAPGNISKWEMDSLNYYCHEHELSSVDLERYHIVNFDDLNPDPEIDVTYTINNQQRSRYRVDNICGTIIDKDNNHNTVTLLTLTGVVTVKFYKGQYNYYAQDIVDIGPDGKKHSIDPSWFNRGNKLFVTGYRSDENFIPRVYKNSISAHAVQLIKSVNENGILLLQQDRIGVNDEGKSAVAV